MKSQVVLLVVIAALAVGEGGGCSKVRDTETDGGAPRASASTSGAPSTFGDTVLQCTGGVCKVAEISAFVKTGLEQAPNREKLMLEFRPGATDADLATISAVPWVTGVTIASKNITDLSPLGALPGLKKIHAFGAERVTRITGLSSLAELEELVLSRTKVDDITAVKGMSKLVLLELDATEVTDLAPLAGVRGLKRLNLYMLHPKDYTPIRGLTKLEELWLPLSNVKDTRLLADMKEMKKLDLSWSQALTEISATKHMPNLESLAISGCPVVDLSPLAGASQLRSLAANGTKVRSLAPLAGITTLTSVDVQGTTVKDLRPLMASAKSLHSLALPKDTPLSAVAPFLTANPKLSVDIAK